MPDSNFPFLTRLVPRSLFVRILLTAAAVFLAAGIVFFRQSSQSMEAILLQGQDRRAKALTSFLDGTITNQRADLDRQMGMIAGMQPLIESAYYCDITGDPQRLRDQVEPIAMSLSGSIEVATVKGKVLYSTNPRRGRARGPQERKSLAMAAAGRPLSSQLVANADGIFLISTRPLYFEDRKPGTAHVPEMTLTTWLALDSAWAHKLATQAAMSVILLHDGTAVASSLADCEGRHWLDDTAVASWPHTLTLAEEAGRELHRFQILPISISASDERLHLAVGDALTRIHAEMARMRRRLLGTIAILTLAVLAILAWSLSQLMPPIRRLIRASEIISRVGPESFAGVETRPSDPLEVQVLSGHFNHMAAELKKRMKTMTDFKAALDEHAIVAITDVRGKIIYANDKFCEISQYQRAELLGRDHRIVNSGHHPQAFMRSLWETIAGGRVWHGAIKNRAKDGSFYWLDTTIVPFLDENGKPLQYIVIRTDITESKLSKEKVEQLNLDLERRVAEKTVELKRSMKVSFMSEKMASIGQLAAGVAHEINNPLGVILGFAQSTTRGLPAGDALELPLKSIEREALRCKKLVSNLLSFSRQGAKNFSEIDLRGALESALSLVETQALLSSVKVRKELSAEPLRVLGDSGQIQQVVINLCSNAIDAMPGGGTLSVRLGLSARKPGYAGIEVSDTGTGIPESITKSVFNAFFTTKPVGQGTGLGLTLVHEIVTRHSGSIDFKSLPERGTVFFVDLPLTTVSGR
ncbi:MAG: ATP-binding protein [Elusimicrobiota bacterium]